MMIKVFTNEQMTQDLPGQVCAVYSAVIQYFFSQKPYPAKKFVRTVLFKPRRIAIVEETLLLAHVSPSNPSYLSLFRNSLLSLCPELADQLMSMMREFQPVLTDQVQVPYDILSISLRDFENRDYSVIGGPPDRTEGPLRLSSVAFNHAHDRAMCFVENHRPGGGFAYVSCAVLLAKSQGVWIVQRCTLWCWGCD